MRALVVTSNTRLSAKLAEVLQPLVPEVDERQDGETALHTFAQNDYQLVVTDLALARLSGPDFIRKVRSLDKGRSVPIVFMSMELKDKALPQRLAQSFRVGPYLQMPFPFPRFLEAAKRALATGAQVPAVPVTPVPVSLPVPQPVAAPAPKPAARLSAPGSGPLKLVWGGSAAGSLPNFEDVMILVKTEGYTCKGRLMGGGKIVALSFHKGLPLAEFTGAGHPALDDYLKAGFLTQDEFDRLKRITPPAEVERLLAGAGVVSPGDLSKKRAEILGVRLGEVLRWPEGTLIMESQSADAGPTERLYGELALAHAVAHDVRASSNPIKLSTLQNQLKNAFLAPAKDLPYFARLLPLSAEEEKVVDLVKRPVAVQEIIRSVRQPDAAWNVIRILLALRLVTRHAQAPQGVNVEFPLAFRSSHRPAAAGSVAAKASGEDTLELIDLSGDLADELDEIVSDLRDKSAVPQQTAQQAAQSDDQRKLENELFDELARAKKVNYYELLGTKRSGFNFQEAKKKYFELQRKFSPDKFIMSAGDVMSKAQELLEKLSVAFETLSDVGKKQNYDQKLSTQQMMAGEGGSGGKTLQADVAFQSGLALMETEEWEAAVKQFEIARKIQPGVTLHEVNQAWAIYKNPKNRGNTTAVAEVKKLLNNAVVRDPRCAIGFAYRAWMLVDDGKVDLAAMEFGKALRIDANLKIAQQGLKKVEDLRKSQKKGLFG